MSEACHIEAKMPASPAHESFLPLVTYFIERHCTKEWGIPEEVIDFHDLTYVISGRAVYYVDDQPHELSSGDLLYIPPGHKRSAHTFPDALMSMYALNFYEQDGKPLTLPFSPVTSIGTHPSLIRFYQMMKQVYLERKAYFSMDAKGIALLILSHCLKLSSGHLSQDTRLESVKQHILKNYPSVLTIHGLAKFANLSPNYLCALFKKNEGISISRYINVVRINQAEAMIVQERVAMNEVAIRCGFSDEFYFSKVFKHIKGYPPSKSRTLRQLAL